MKTILITLIVVLLTLAGAAQEEKSTILLDLEGVEICPPQFTGFRNYSQSHSDFDRVQAYLKQNIKYPTEAAKCRIEGTEVVKFTVTREGGIKDIRCVNSVCPDIDAEMIRAIKSTSGMWQPGLKNGIPTSMTQEVTLAFALNRPGAAVEDFRQKAEMNYNKACKLMVEDRKLKKAERYFNKAINYTPKHQSLYYLRAMCKYETGDREGAIQDLNRFTEITGYSLTPEELVFDVREFDGDEAFWKLSRKQE